jgi:hypothetical protein
VGTGSAGGPERSRAAWSGGWSRSAVTVLRRRGGCRGALRVPPFLFAAVAWGARGAALRAAIRWSPPVTPSRRRARWPCARLPMTTAAAWCPVVALSRSRRGASQCSPPHWDVQAGSTAITCSPALAVIWTRRSRNRAVGRPATTARNLLPRTPLDGRRPARSRPRSRASAKSRFSLAIAWQPCSRATVIRAVMAVRIRPSRCGAGRPASARGTVTGGAGGVAVGGDGPPGEVPVVQVHGQHRPGAQFPGRGNGPGGCPPARVQVPAAPAGIIGDVIPHRAGGSLGRYLVAAVGELNPARQPVPAVRPVRQVRERARGA